MDAYEYRLSEDPEVAMVCNTTHLREIGDVYKLFFDTFFPGCDSSADRIYDRLNLSNVFTPHTEMATTFEVHRREGEQTR